MTLCWSLKVLSKVHQPISWTHLSYMMYCSSFIFVMTNQMASNYCRLCSTLLTYATLKWRVYRMQWRLEKMHWDNGDKWKVSKITRMSLSYLQCWHAQPLRLLQDIHRPHLLLASKLQPNVWRWRRVFYIRERGEGCLLQLIKVMQKMSLPRCQSINMMGMSWFISCVYEWNKKQM